MDNPFTERLPGAGVGARRRGEALRRPSVPWGQAAAYVVPAAVALAAMAAAWEVWVRLLDVKVYILPRPSAGRGAAIRRHRLLRRPRLDHAVGGYGGLRPGVCGGAGGGHHHGALQGPGEEPLSPGGLGQGDAHRGGRPAVRHLVRLRLLSQGADRGPHHLLPGAGQRADGSALSRPVSPGLLHLSPRIQGGRSSSS